MVQIKAVAACCCCCCCCCCYIQVLFKNSDVYFGASLHEGGGLRVGEVSRGRKLARLYAQS